MAKIASGISNFDSIKESDFTCLTCDKAKAIWRLNILIIENLIKVLDVLEGDIFIVKPTFYNKCLVRLFIIDRKTRYRWLFLLKNKEGPIMRVGFAGPADPVRPGRSPGPWPTPEPQRPGARTRSSDPSTPYITYTGEPPLFPSLLSSLSLESSSIVL